MKDLKKVLLKYRDWTEDIIQNIKEFNIVWNSRLIWKETKKDTWPGNWYLFVYEDWTEYFVDKQEVKTIHKIYGEIMNTNS